MEIDESRLNKMRQSLTRVLTTGDDNAVRVTRAAPRQARMFTTKTSVQFGENTPNGRTVLDLFAADQPGLLSKVGQTFIEQSIDIEAAKIMTIGERAEDVFYITDEAGEPLADDAKDQLRDELIAKLDDECKI
jgi:[protein-PII] uridylyltransferase